MFREQTTDSGVIYIYSLPSGETITGGLEDIVRWIEANEHLVDHPHLTTANYDDVDDDVALQGLLGDVDKSNSYYYDGSGKENIYHESSHLRGFVHSANIGTVITAGNMFFNLLLIVLVLLRRSLRGQFVYQQVLNLALADLAFSVVVDPFSVYFELQPWRLAPGFCVAWMMLDAALPFVSFLCLISLNLDRILFTVLRRHYRRVEGGRRRRVWFRMLVLSLPWAVGMGVVLPLWMFTAVAWPQPGICLYGITKKAAVASACLSLFLPCVVLIVLTVLVLVTLIGGMPHDFTDMSVQQQGGHHHHHHNHHHYLPSEQGDSRRVGGGPSHVRMFLGGGVHPFHNSTTTITTNTNSNSATLTHENSLDKTPETRKSYRSLVVAVCVLNLTTVITQLPYGAISLLEPQCTEPSCQSTIKLLQTLSWVRSCTFTLHPLLLVLLLRQVRRACCGLCRRERRHQQYQHQHQEVNGPIISGSTGAVGVGSTDLSALPTPTTTTTKTDQVELTSIHNDLGPVPGWEKRSSSTML
ncbi:uncharacterized protein LOC143297126 [Babylonia areolata]|uniref:uncharacterized protein LOC143297126 n=1 Tax=Babylonia areolata TaxID=304850 RepID=UPI003FD5A96B